MGTSIVIFQFFVEIHVVQSFCRCHCKDVKKNAITMSACTFMCFISKHFALESTMITRKYSKSLQLLALLLMTHNKLVEWNYWSQSGQGEVKLCHISLSTRRKSLIIKIWNKYCLYTVSGNCWRFTFYRWSLKLPIQMYRKTF